MAAIRTVADCDLVLRSLESEGLEGLPAYQRLLDLRAQLEAAEVRTATAEGYETADA